MVTFSASGTKQILRTQLLLSPLRKLWKTAKHRAHSLVRPFLNSQTFTATWINKAFWKPERQKPSQRESSLSTDKCPTTVGHCGWWMMKDCELLCSQRRQQTNNFSPMMQILRTVSCYSLLKCQGRNSDGSSWVGMRFEVRKRRYGYR